MNRNTILALLALGTSSAACVAEDTTSLERHHSSGGDSSSPPAGAEAPVVEGAPARESPVETGAGRDPEANAIDDDGQALIEGDIVPPEVRPGVAGNARASNPWPGGVVAYVIDAKLPDRARVTSAIAHWESRTGIRFVARGTEAAYVVFVRGSGCSSTIGRTGRAQKIKLAANCDAGSVVHEIGHAVGLWHEQSRSDRDAYVTVHLENVQRGMEHNFDKTEFKSPGAYDLGSIMHYGSTYFSANGKPTLTRRDGSVIVPNRSALSASDIAGIKIIYAGS